jgi:hypothetical protein
LTTAETAELADAYLRALVVQLADDRNSFDLRHTTTQQGHRLVELMTELLSTPWPEHRLYRTIESDDDADRLLLELTAQIAGPPGSIASAQSKPAAVRVADLLVERARRGSSGGSSWKLVDDELFCALYRLFFADAITGFLAGVIAAKMSVLLPGVALIDPAGQLTGYLAEKIAEEIPTPCEEKSGKRPDDPLGDIAQDLVSQTFDRWLDRAVEDVA